MSPRVSIIIASHRADFVGGCLDALSKETSSTIPSETIVVADYPLGNLPRDFPDISWEHLADRSISAKRNAGAKIAKGEYLAFLDDDCRPMGGWLQAGVNVLKETPSLAGVEGQTVVESTDAKHGAYREFKRLEKQGYRTNNIMYRKDVFIKAGMFDERFTLQREDVDLAFTILESGKDIGFCQNMLVVHLFRPKDTWDLLKNCVNRRFDPLLYKKHKQLYRKHIGGPFTPSIAILLGGYACTGVVGLWHMETSLACLAATAILAGAMTVRRIRGTGTGAVQFLREFASYVLSPFVLLAATLHGSIRFRAFLIF